MRKLILAFVALIALTAGARADNTATTFQVGVVNGSSVNQQGHVNDSSTTTQVGLVNGALTLQGTTTPSLNNSSSVLQIGAVNAAATGQVATGNNTSTIGQFSIGGPPNNFAAVGQIGGGLNLSSITQH
jgi:major curlin subunit